jgi:Flp pilus assembly pilin Flp
LLRLFIKTGEFSPTQVLAGAAVGAGKSRAYPLRELRIRTLISRLLSDRSGATAIKHCLIAVGISILIATVVNGIGRKLNSRDNSVSPELQQEREKRRRRGPLPSPPFLSGQARAPASRPSSLLPWAACR